MSKLPFTSEDRIGNVQARGVSRNGLTVGAVVRKPSTFAGHLEPSASAADRLRDAETVDGSALAVRCQELLREAYDALGSAGALAMTLQNSSASASQRETLDLVRQVCRDCACDVSQAAYRMPRDYHGALANSLKG